jgi:hypothetical protein
MLLHPYCGSGFKRSPEVLDLSLFTADAKNINPESKSAKGFFGLRRPNPLFSYPTPGFRSLPIAFEA